MPIELINLTKTYGDLVAVDNLSVTFDDRSLNVLIGPSGCGKTTVLKTLNRLLPITSGDIRYDGISIHDIDPIELRRSIGYVIQEIGLFPHLTIFENIAVVPRLLHWSEKRIADRVHELLDLVNIDPGGYADKYPAQLSGGQRQRVGVARGLAADPKILLMDEPFGAIDPINRETLQDSFLEIQREIQKTIVFVTHDIREAVKLGDRIAILQDGKLIQYDETMKILNNPANEFVEDLLGSDRALKGLELLRVEDNYDRSCFSMESDGTRDAGWGIGQLEAEGRAFGFVKDPENRLLGYVMLRELQRGTPDRPLDECLHTATAIQPMSTLMEAVAMMLTSGITSAPVVDKSNRILGVVRFREVFQKVSEVANAAGDPERIP